MDFFKDLDLALKLLWYIALLTSVLAVFQVIFSFLKKKSTQTIVEASKSLLSYSDTLFSTKNLIYFLFIFSWTGIAYYRFFSSSLTLFLFSFFIGCIGILLLRYFYKKSITSPFPMSVQKDL